MTRIFLGALIAYAAIGLVVSLFAHLESFFVAPPGGHALFFALHVAIFPLWIAVAILANRFPGDGWGFGRRQSRVDWKWMLAGCPVWMRIMTYGFFAYAIANFVIFLLLTATGHGSDKYAGGPSTLVWHGFSGHWMAFYSAGLAFATAAYSRGRARSAS